MEISACQDLRRKERVKETKMDHRKAKKIEVLWKMRKHSPCIMVTFFIFTSYCNLSTKWLLHWIWIHVNFCHWLCVTPLNIQLWFLFSTHISLPYQKIFAFLLPVAAYAFFFLTNVQNLYPDLHIKTQPKQRKSISWAHTSYFYEGF